MASACIYGHFARVVSCYAEPVLEYANRIDRKRESLSGSRNVFAVRWRPQGAELMATA